jgi:ribosomal protein L23
MSKTLAMLPLLNEKTYELSKSKNVYVFKVPIEVNKQTIAKSIKAQFEVDAVAVNTTHIKGKAKRIMSLTGKRSVNAEGHRPDYKKAYVTLKKDQSLPFFEAVEEAEEKRESNQEKFDKAASKQASKEAKTKNVDTGSKRRFLRTKKPDGK